MGCDIDIFIERKVDGKWISADKWTPNKYAGEEGEPPMCVEYEDRFYRGRNYCLFAMLANVRNGVGFAGCDTGDGFKPVVMPKGLPSDVSPEVKAESDQWDDDGHSHSWLTLAELNAYDWKGQTTKHRGWVDPWNFILWKRDGKLSTYSGGVSGLGVEHISNQMMAYLTDPKNEEIIFEGEEPEKGSWMDRSYTTKLQRMLRQVGDFPSGSIGSEMQNRGSSYYTLVEWEESYYESVKPFVDETLPKMDALSYGRPENVRIVFWFDN